MDSEDIKSNSAAAAMAAAKVNVLSKLERKNVMENIIPLVLSLYRMLQTNKSRLIKYLVPYFAKLMKEFKDEVTEVLGAENRIVAEEIEFALKKEARKQAERERQETIQAAKEKQHGRRMSVSTSRRLSTLSAATPNHKERRMSSATARRLSSLSASTPLPGGRRMSHSTSRRLSALSLSTPRPNGRRKSLSTRQSLSALSVSTPKPKLRVGVTPSNRRLSA
mmetsp:Transcript_4320/g.4845  ORF Transcript_4320/g.4845 Transcript_4320/m.4845 type:complete len:222 (-) Transcript_4320:129-794(-)